MSRKEVSDILFPHVNESVEDVVKKYPKRKKGQIVSRFAPSPTGFLHVGSLRTAFIAWKIAMQEENGIFMIRVEDTDQSRIVDDAIDHMLSSLKMFDISAHEGPLGVDNTDIGKYGPYIQSKREYLYHVFVKDLISKGKAYPCWMTEEELESIRDQQMKSKINTGIYGNYSIWRNKTSEEILQKLNGEDFIDYGKEDKEQKRVFAIRLRSHGDIGQTIVFEDILRGKVSMKDNYNDVPILKSTGLPTYHMAHVVDDFLMGTNPVIRAEEWLMSTPLHLQIFDACGLSAPTYCHPSQVLKLDEKTGNKRKLSKRKDPESDVGYYFKNGYSVEGLLDYLLILVDSGFEEWQIVNPDKTYKDYKIDLKKMNKAGAMFDLKKLDSVNNNYLSRISNDQLFYQTLEWAKLYNPDFAVLLESNEDYAKSAISIERHTEKDPKRFITFIDVEQQLKFFFDKEREILINKLEESVLNDVITKELLSKFVPDYLDILNLTMSTEDWFAQLKEIGRKYGFAGNNAEFKEGGYIGKIGSLAMFLRLQLCAAKKTPDLFSVMKVLGKDRIQKRLQVTI